MASVNLQRLLKELKALTPAERRELLEVVDATLAPAQTKEDELDQRLLLDGVISRVPEPRGAPARSPERPLVEVSGKPLSETIVEERR